MSNAAVDERFGAGCLHVKEAACCSECRQLITGIFVSLKNL